MGVSISQAESAWSALAQEQEDGHGYKTIPLLIDEFQVHAGVKFPERSPSVLISFNQADPSSDYQIRDLRGLSLEITKLKGSDARWLCVTKQPNGEFALFKLIAKDLLDTISNLTEVSPDHCFQRVFQRVRTWIDFLRLEKRGMSQNAQVGLFGELMVIQGLKVLGMSSREVASAWVGPSRALHDFEFLASSLEVKTSLNNEKMIYVDSPEQLQPMGKPKLLLGFVELTLDESGQTLPELLEKCLEDLQDDPIAVSDFETQILKTDFYALEACEYKQRYTSADVAYFEVTDDFPRLKRENLPSEILSVRYQTSLKHSGDLIISPEIALQALRGG